MREVACEPAGANVVLLGEATDVVPQREEALEERACLGEPAEDVELEDTEAVGESLREIEQLARRLLLEPLARASYESSYALPSPPTMTVK